jgi:hypothetical protein
MRMSKVSFGRFCSLLPSLFRHWPSFRLFWIDHPQRLFFSYDNLLALGQLGLRWLNHDLLPIELSHLHVRWGWDFVELHLETFCEF